MVAESAFQIFRPIVRAGARACGPKSGGQVFDKMGKRKAGKLSGLSGDGIHRSHRFASASLAMSFQRCAACLFTGRPRRPVS